MGVPGDLDPLQSAPYGRQGFLLPSRPEAKALLQSPVQSYLKIAATTTQTSPVTATQTSSASFRQGEGTGLTCAALSSQPNMTSTCHKAAPPPGVWLHRCHGHSGSPGYGRSWLTLRRMQGHQRRSHRSHGVACVLSTPLGDCLRQSVGSV